MGCFRDAVPRVSILDIGSCLDNPFQGNSQVTVRVRRKYWTMAAAGQTMCGTGEWPPHHQSPPRSLSPSPGPHPECYGSHRCIRWGLEDCPAKSYPEGQPTPRDLDQALPRNSESSMAPIRHGTREIPSSFLDKRCLSSQSPS